MIPVVTPVEMRVIDASAPEPVEVLIARAANAVARSAIDLLGGCYGRRVVVVAGRGNNGNDGRVAADRLAARGVRVEVIDAADPPERFPHCDLAIDAAYGTGFRGRYDSPIPSGVPTLAVDIPSGIDGLTGVASGHPARAIRTVTFAALKPGLLFGDGPPFAGEIEVADIGLDVDSAQTHLVTAGDVAAGWPSRCRDAHKWQHAVWVIAGSEGMAGAAHLATTAAFGAGASYVRLTVPGGVAPSGGPPEAVGVPLAPDAIAAIVDRDASRFGAIVIGPGLGRDPAVAAAVRAVARRADCPLVIDGDGLWAMREPLAWETAAARVLTPHDGEYATLSGSPPGPDRIAAARALAADRAATVLLKGPSTVVATPDGACRIVTSGDARLATAGTGDVLSGAIGALLAAGATPLAAASLGAQVHGAAGRTCPAVGTRAGDVAAALAATVSTLVEVRADEGAVAARSGRRQ
ncbi:MAG: NAD(P)H-hydrate dehydratase [Actinobacteria bacterium]|nr:NAD(P)H-hydrate dehydratase [Actinomycetota bacterium]